MVVVALTRTSAPTHAPNDPFQRLRTSLGGPNPTGTQTAELPSAIAR